MCKRNSVDSVPRWPILLLKCFSSSIFSFHYSVADRCLCWPIGSLECGWSCSNSSNEKQRVQSTIDQSHVNRSKRDGHMPRQLCHMPPLISINLTVFQTKIIHFFCRWRIHRTVPQLKSDSKIALPVQVIVRLHHSSL